MFPKSADLQRCEVVKNHFIDHIVKEEYRPS